MGVFLIVLSSLGFGIMPIFAIYAYASGITVPTLLLIRFTLASTLFFLYLFFKKERISLSRMELLGLFILGGVCYTAQSTLYFSSVRYITPALAVLLLYLYPVFVAVLSFLVDKERLTAKVLISSVLSLAGVVLINLTLPEGVKYQGVAMAVGAALVYSFYIILGNRVVKKVPPLVTSTFVALFTALGLLVSGLASGQIGFSFEGTAWFSILGLTLFSTVLAILTFFKGLELLGSTKSSILSMIEPVFTIIFSTVLLGESFTLRQLGGGLLVVAGAVFIVLAQSRSKSC